MEMAKTEIPVLKLSEKRVEEFRNYIKAGKNTGVWSSGGPMYGPATSPGRPTGSSLKDKDSIIQETVERLSEAIAKLCNRYNFSDSVQMTTEVDLVETANYTTVILTATIEWLPNPYVFVAQEKVKTSNKTVSSPLRGTTIPSGVGGINMVTTHKMEQMQKQLEDRQKWEEITKKYARLNQQEPPF